EVVGVLHRGGGDRGLAGQVQVGGAFAEVGAVGLGVLAGVVGGYGGEGEEHALDAVPGGVEDRRGGGCGGGADPGVEADVAGGLEHPGRRSLADSEDDRVGLLRGDLGDHRGEVGGRGVELGHEVVLAAQLLPQLSQGDADLLTGRGVGVGDGELSGSGGREVHGEARVGARGTRGGREVVGAGVLVGGDRPAADVGQSGLLHGGQGVGAEGQRGVVDQGDHTGVDQVVEALGGLGGVAVVVAALHHHRAAVDAAELLVDVGGPGLVDGLHRAVVPAGVGGGEDGAEPDRLSFQAAGAGRGVRGSRTACAGGQGEYQRGRGRAACEGSDGGSPAHGAVAPCHRAGIGRSAGTGGSSVPAGVDGDGV